jgi:hypothetical protein
MISDLIRETLKDSTGKLISFRKLNNFYYEGLVLAVDEQFLKYNDRRNGVSVCSLSEIKEVISIK